MPDYSRYEFIKVEKAERVATVTLNRPDRLNAVNPGLHHELMTIWNDLAEDREVNAIILTGAGRAFCAGGDVKGMASGTLASPSGGTSERITAAEGRRIVQNMLDVEQPIIGAINGDAVGLGATIALLCDIIVASEKARFADTHVKVGVVAGDGGAVIWPLLIGPARAKEFLMRGHFVNGADAFKMGMVNYAVAPGAGDGEGARAGAGAGRRADLGDSLEQARGQQVAQAAGQPDPRRIARLRDGDLHHRRPSRGRARLRREAQAQL
jgi:enoyl-CoA hydratase